MDNVYEQVMKNLNDNENVQRNMSEYGTTFQTEQLSPYNTGSYTTHISCESLPDDEIKKLLDNCCT